MAAARTPPARRGRARNVGAEAYRGAVRPRASFRANAQRILRVLVRAIRDSIPGIVAGNDPDALHDLRVALRRYRVLLRGLRRTMNGTTIPLERDLARLFREVGPARDAEVWLQFIEKLAEGQSKRMPADRRACLQAVRSRHRAETKRLQRVLAAPAAKRALGRAESFVRVTLARPCGGEGSEPFDREVSRRIRRLYSRLEEEDVHRRLSADELHEARVRIRRARYWAEMGAPVLHRSVAELDARLHRVAAALGDVHDADLHLSATASDGPALPRAWRRRLSRERRKALDDVEDAWDRLMRKGFRKRVLDALYRT